MYWMKRFGQLIMLELSMRVTVSHWMSEKVSFLIKAVYLPGVFSIEFAIKLRTF